MTAALTRRGILKAGLAGASMVLGSDLAGAGTPQAPLALSAPLRYVDPTVLDRLPFGASSHYLQPWRSYLSSVPAGQFLSGIGVVLDEGHQTPVLFLDILARSGVRTVRLEISWGEFSFEDEHHLRDEASFRRVLAACRDRQLRPLLLLNAHHGLPVPVLKIMRHTTADAAAGARTLALDSSKDLVIGRSGLSDLSEFWAAENLIIDIKGSEIALAKPLAKPIPAGAQVNLATLKYAPFGSPNTPDTNATLDGWVRYVESTARFATSALATEKAGDKGFDLEIWNELSFGSKFLSNRNYLETSPNWPNTDDIQAEIVARTAASLRARPALFAGVKLINGFSSTIPWPAASKQPTGINGLSKHPYPRLLSFPRDEVAKARRLNAQAKETAFIPSYQAYFPEYFASAIQTETVMRDMAPITTDIYGTSHGRDARKLDGKVLPVPVWITEIGTNPGEIGVKDANAARSLKAKSTARFLLFYLNKGAERVYLYSATGGDIGYGLVPDAVRGFTSQTTLYPWQIVDAPALQVMSRIAAVFGNLPADEPTGAIAAPTRSLGFNPHANPTSARQFAGDGSAGNPDIRNIDMLVLLPFHIDEHRFVVGYYFMTRDIRQSITPEMVTLDITGLRGPAMMIKSYDPIADHWETPQVDLTDKTRTRLALEVTDYPRLLTINDSRRIPAGSTAGSPL